jgi:hypothetical protein
MCATAKRTAYIKVFTLAVYVRKPPVKLIFPLANTTGGTDCRQ